MLEAGAAGTRPTVTNLRRQADGKQVNRPERQTLRVVDRY